ncbi:MAG: hypothetical protein GY870_00285, partial [archaeon]|nr:hypothetical protein [archaeon]
MLRKKILGFILISCVCVSIFSVLYLKDEKINNENANDLTNQNINLDLPKNSYSIFDFSPFLNHSEEDFITYTYDLYDATTPQQSYSNDDGTVIFPYYPHSFNDSKEITVIDNDYYSADQFYYIMGAGYQIGAMGNVLFYLDTPFYDDTPGEEGFYHRLDEDLTILDSGNKTAFDNLLAIVPAFPGMEASINDASFFPTMTDLWNNSKNLFYSENNINGFNQSTSGLDSSSKYSRDNYLAAMVGFQMAKSPYFNIENPDAATYISYIADKIMNDFTYDTALDATIGFRPSYSLVGESYTVLQSSIELIDNALAISAHLAWNIAGGMNQTSENVTKSEGIWRSIYDNLYNSTYDMYMSTCGT